MERVRCWLLCFTAICAGFLVLNLRHFFSLQNDIHAQLQSTHAVLEDFLASASRTTKPIASSSSPGSSSSSSRSRSSRRFAHLSCAAHGGPSDEDAQEMVYWQEISQDDAFISPYRRLNKKNETQYLTFEPDEGGWNNMRMALETVLVIALATGRTVVLPPEQRMYLLWDDQRQQQQGGAINATTSLKKDPNALDFADFFPLREIAQKTAGLDVISLEDFLQKEGLSGRLRNAETGEVTFPPYNRTDWGPQAPDASSGRGGVQPLLSNWQSARGGHGAVLWSWMRDSTTFLKWRPNSCVAVIPSQSTQSNYHATNNTALHADRQRVSVQSYMDQILKHEEKIWGGVHRRKRFQNRAAGYTRRPTPVNATALERMAEIMADRVETCVYNEDLQESLVVHLSGEQGRGNQPNYRLLVPWYSFVFLEDHHMDLWTKRFVRDHLRYLDEIQCAAARVVAAIRKRSTEYHLNSTRTENNTSTSQFAGRFDAMHIRRGDFQYKTMHMPAQVLYEQNMRHMLQEGRTLYVATDEKDKSYFDPWREHYHLLFLRDFKDQLGDISPNYYGMVEQLIASRGDVFIGAFYSTFTGYINRLRGYYSQRDQLKDYQMGILESYYYAPDSMSNVRNIMRSYVSVQPPYWQREFPVGWRDLDADVDDER